MEIKYGLDVMLFLCILPLVLTQAISLPMQGSPVLIPALEMGNVKENSVFDLIFNFRDLLNIFKLF
jgi:hypothetical protein